MMACQDVAVDGWAVTILSEKYAPYAPTTQIVGIMLGYHASTTVYFALNSIDFCNKYIYSAPQSVPLLTEGAFFKIWSLWMLFMTVYTLLLHSERDDKIKVHESDEITSLKEIMKISVKLLLNKNMLLLFSFFCANNLLGSIAGLVGKIYLIDDLGYSQEKLSYLSL
jgi:hypothetical protein